MRVRTLGIVGIALLLSCFATATFAADRVIQNGIDVLVTPRDGSTFVDFAKTPIPAGFFCPGSAPFTGKVAFRGEPIVTGTPGALGAADTIVQRLDDAAFNKRGVARTRVQFRALSLRSLAPIETECGKFTVTASLDGVQPITRMVITRENKTGGRFTAPLALNVKVRFEPVGRVSEETLEIPVAVRFQGTVKMPWQRAAAPVPAGFVLVDTDGDRVADTYLPGTSNFFVGKAGRAAREAGSIEKGYYSCHTDEAGHQHCFWTCTFQEQMQGTCGVEP
ncbi:MAG TPA: hypothetical protein VLE27_03505 [Thermoanaerobaculia bacterium]|nr:hypothetical protein [Thermoanaerobaculia bacterium]